MTVPVPNLDNRTFEQLLKEARRSIPNYAPEWTNHNTADPGITLIELIAWLAEITSYRINLVTEEHLLKYLKLLGVRPQGSQSAITDLRFEMGTNVDLEKGIFLEKGTVFLAEKDGERIDFELLEGIRIVPLELKKIVVNKMPVDLSPPSSSISLRGNSHSQVPSSNSLPNKKSGISAKIFDIPLKSLNEGLKTSEKKEEATSEKKEEAYGYFERSDENTTKDLFFAPFGLDAKKGSELYLGFHPNNEKHENESPKSLNLMCYLYEKDLIPPGKHGDEQEYEFENARLKWEIFVGSNKNNGEKWKEISIKDGTQNFTKSGSLHFTGLEGWVCSFINFWPSPKGDKQPEGGAGKYFWLRCTLMRSNYEYPPRIESIHLNTTPVIQKKRLTNLMLGKSSGLPGQIFKLPKLPETPVLRGSTKLALEEEWKEVEDFDGSNPEDTHFTLESLKGEIRFGDGLWGKIPPIDTEIRVIEYEIGRGESGNLPANSSWVVKEKDIKGLKEISNLKPATGGKDEESIDEAFERFIRDLKVPYRAVTSEDYEYIARETPGLRVAQAKAIPNFNRRSNAEEKGTVTVVVVPFSLLNTFKTPPKLSRCFRNAVARHLDKHRLLGTFVYVVSPDYVRVEVQVTLGISKGFSEEEIRKDVLDKLILFLHPIKGDFSGKGWPVGKNVYRSEIYKLIMEIEGVDFVEKIKICAKEGVKPDKKGDLKLPLTATVYSGEHSIEILRTPEKRR